MVQVNPSLGGAIKRRRDSAQIWSARERIPAGVMRRPDWKRPEPDRDRSKPFPDDLSFWRPMRASAPGIIPTGDQAMTKKQIAAVADAKAATRKAAALQAHRTRVANAMKGTRGKAKLAATEKLAQYDRRIAAVLQQLAA
jgi:hypothetical protein